MVAIILQFFFGITSLGRGISTQPVALAFFLDIVSFRIPGKQLP